MSEDDTSKTEEATPEKQRQAREEGQFPRTQDAGAVASSIAVLLVLMGLGPTFATRLSDFASECFSATASRGASDWGQVAKDLGLTVAVLCIPLALAAAIAGSAMGFMQAGFQPNLDLASVKWSRIDPLAKLKGLFSPKAAATNTLMSVARVSAVGAVTYWVLSGEFETLRAMSRMSLHGGGRAALAIASKSALAALGCLAALAAADYGQAWLRHRRDLRMSLQEVKDEHKQQEGDPKVKMRQRQRAREMMRRGLAQEVKKCAVVVANPTHIAVGIRYSPELGVPVVVAKGYDDIALFIRKLAGQYEVPVIENRPLARALAAQVRVGRPIPADLYTAVAEVLAIVYRLRRRWGN